MVLAVLVLLVARCDLTEPVDRQTLVVEAFFETGDSFPAITLRETQPLHASSNGSNDAAVDAEIDLIVDGKTIPYKATADEPGRYQPETDVGVVPSGVPWQLTVEWKEEVAQARGTTPRPIEISELCVEVPPAPVRAIFLDSLRRDSLDIPAKQGYIYPVDVSIRWSPDQFVPRRDTMHWVRPQVRPDTAESSSRVVNFFLEPVDVRREDRFGIRNGNRFWEGVYAIPVEDSASRFPQHDLTATVVRGDTAFAAFARSRNDPDRREPISNVEGGLGIATSVAVDSLQRRVEPKLDQCYSPRLRRP